jgi:hypothetical protein
MAIHTIQVTRYVAQPNPPLSGSQNGESFGYSVQIIASGAVGMPNEVFVEHQRPLNPLCPTAPLVSDFWGVATTSELVDLPINAPLPGQFLYRVANVSIVYPSQVQADASWQGIETQVQSLINALYASDDLNVIDTFVPIAPIN